MKKAIGTIIGWVILLIVFAGGVLLYGKLSTWAPYYGKGGYYLYPMSEKEGYVLRFEDKKTIDLYRYNKALYEERHFYYGLKTKYTYSGEEYTSLVANLHLKPGSQLLFWNQFAWYDDDIEKRATIKLSAKENTALNLDEFEAVTGKFTDTVIETDKEIIIGDMHFSVPETPDDWTTVMEIVTEFDTFGVTVK